MNIWKELKHIQELSKIQKILLGMLIIVVVMLVPESAFLLDAGGIDLILFILLMYSQNLKLWFNAHFGALRYPSLDNRTFVTHSTVSSLFWWMTGSVLLAYGFFLVSMFMRGVQ